MTTESQIAGVRSGLADATRIVIKIGSSLLVDDESGLLNRLWLDSLAGEIVRLRERGQQVLIVSSGAIALGRKYLGLEPAQRRLEEHQAAAAAGQVLLAHAYQDLLGDRNIRVAQVLLTLDDTENRRRYLNARSTLDTLLRLGAVPVINENDTVATHEIRYGDNDRLGARVAEMVSADCLVLLSDVDGLYDADPADNPQARLIEEVAAITRKIESLAGETSTAYGSGGMITKLKAARIAVAAGCATVIANGRQLQPIMAVEDGGPATWFIPRKTPLAARKQWIGGSLKSCGRLIVDAGAETALVKGSSLLPVGIVSVDGDFERGDAITVSNVEGREIACGLAAYSSHDARKISGRRSDEIEGLLGYAGRDEIIHRDDLVLLDG
ncbi:MAG: glutamate 5-kinase [Chromatiales bacterium]|nr:glutamate 5-kinase [Chromatiales bacterium]